MAERDRFTQRGNERGGAGSPEDGGDTRVIGAHEADRYRAVQLLVMATP